jgi:hypothetical protein
MKNNQILRFQLKDDINYDVEASKCEYTFAGFNGIGIDSSFGIKLYNQSEEIMNSIKIYFDEFKSINDEYPKEYGLILDNIIQKIIIDSLELDFSGKKLSFNISHWEWNENEDNYIISIVIFILI